MPPLGRFHHRSLICDTHELRITQRCLAEDLREAQDAPIESLERREIVRTFLNERSRDPAPAALGHIGRGRTERPLVPLRHGHDHRGATWHEAEVGVVWLCACHSHHRSGQEGDSFDYFRELLEADLIYPVEDDYVVLAEDQAARFAGLAPEDARALLARAHQAADGEEIRGIIGRTEEVGVAVRIVETMNELYVAFSYAAFLHPTRGLILLSAFGPEGATFTDWRQETALPRRALDQGEVCFSIVK